MAQQLLPQQNELETDEVILPPSEPTSLNSSVILASCGTELPQRPRHKYKDNIM
jgi:hypothetical protein